MSMIQETRFGIIEFQMPVEDAVFIHRSLKALAGMIEKVRKHNEKGKNKIPQVGKSTVEDLLRNIENFEGVICAFENADEVVFLP